MGRKQASFDWRIDGEFLCLLPGRHVPIGGGEAILQQLLAISHSLLLDLLSNPEEPRIVR